MRKSRMEAFSDGVLAIIITIMVLELDVPHGVEPRALVPVLPVLMSYVLSFVYLGIYWNNHHHLLQAVERVDGPTLWANLHLLFWLSLVPFVTAWMGENEFAAWPVAFYGMVLLGAAIAYFILVRALLARHGPDSKLARAIGSDVKGKLSALAYVVSIPLALWVHPWAACGVFVGVATVWLVPDRRIERVIAD